jgi:cell division transport system ATP-binding protein
MIDTDAARLQTLRAEYEKLKRLEDRQQVRGQRLNGLIAEMLCCWGFTASSDLHGTGETDVAFTLDGRRVVLEAKWQTPRVQTDAIAKLQKRLRQRLGGTLGFFLSMSGYTRGAIADLKEGERAEVVLLDQTHFEAMLYGSIPPRALFDTAIDEASWRGLVYPSIPTILASLAPDLATPFTDAGAASQDSLVLKNQVPQPGTDSRPRRPRHQSPPRVAPEIPLRPPPGELLRLERVGKTYPNGIVALREIDLTIRERDFVFIVGPSGAGKSTLLRILGGEEAPSSGRALVGNDDIRNTPRADLRRLISVVNQDLRLMGRATVARNVVAGLGGRTFRHEREMVEETLWIVGLEAKVDARLSELSRGEQQRVALGRALISRSRILIADDALGNLDPDMSWGVVQILLQINHRGTTIVISTNNSEIVDLVRRRVLELDKGQLIRDEDEGPYRDLAQWADRPNG